MLKAAALALFQVAIAHDKGKPVARQGRKAVSLLGVDEPKGDCLVAEGDRKRR